MADIHLVQESPGKEPARIAVGGRVLIGRGADCNVTLRDDLVSRHHARVEPKGDGVELTDLGSTNGTTVEGRKVQAVDLVVGGAFKVGRTTFTVAAGKAGEAPAKRPTLAPATLPGRAPTPEAPAGTGLVVTEGSEDSIFEASSNLTIDHDAVETHTQSLSMGQMAVLSRKLAALNKIASSLASILEVDKLLEEVADQVFGLFPRAHRCCILLDENGDLRPVKVKTRTGEHKDGDEEIRLSRTVIRMNREQRKAVMCMDTATDQQLSAAASIVAQGIRSIMSVPIVSKEEFFGILYLDTADLGSTFSSDDLELLASIASQVAIFVKNARLVGQIATETELRTNLGRYLSPSVVAEIAQGNLVPSLGGESRDGTCLFSDIVGFTRICRNLPAADVVALLNRFFRELVDAVFQWDGTVDKFGGDAMLCVWGAPVAVEDHASPAIGSALEMQKRAWAFNLGRADDEVQVRMGIGLNSGSFIAGNVGSEERLEYTVIGDNVNLAQRTEEKASGGMVLVTDVTRQQAHGVAGIRMQPTVIRGPIGEIIVHSVRGIRPPDAAEGFLHTATLCAVKPAGGGDETEGIIVSVDRRPEGIVAALRLPLGSAAAEADALSLALHMPEVPDVPVLSGGVLDRDDPGEDDPWVGVSVLFSELPEPLDTIFRADSAWESPRRPDDIPRK